MDEARANNSEESFEELLKQHDIDTIEVGSIRKGKVVEISSDDVTVDIG